MMIDPIKKYVEENRADFDHLEAPVNVLQKIQERLKNEALEKDIVVEKKKTVPLFNKTAWLVAASVLLAITTTLILNRQGDKEKSPAALVHQSRPKAVIEGPVYNKIDQQKQQDKPARLAKAAQPHRNDSLLKLREEPIPADLPAKDLYARLRDSSSASMRLSAVLEIEKTGKINNNVLDSLAKTLNNDSNSNVRLAALNVMGQYADDQHASSLLVRSFSTQADPLVQLGLVALLGKVENVKVEDRLFALAEDPNTFAAVKNEAYAALLNQNKL